MIESAEPVRGSESRTALVTGAGRGIGRAIALALAGRGWTVAVNYRLDRPAAEATCSDAERAGGKALLFQMDVGNPSSHGALLDGLVRTVRSIDLLVNNAGIAPRERMDLLETTEESYDAVMAVNLKGPFFLTQRVARLMADGMRTGLYTRPPAIVNIGSISAYTSHLNRAEYCISKAGLAMVTALFADRLAEYGIQVFEIRPGIIETDMTGPAHERYDGLIREGLTPFRRWGRPEDVAAAVAAVAEGTFPFSTGQVINVDGGFYLRRL